MKRTMLFLALGLILPGLISCKEEAPLPDKPVEISDDYIKYNLPEHENHFRESSKLGLEQHDLIIPEGYYRVDNLVKGPAAEIMMPVANRQGNVGILNLFTNKFIVDCMYPLSDFYDLSKNNSIFILNDELDGVIPFMGINYDGETLIFDNNGNNLYKGEQIPSGNIFLGTLIDDSGPLDEIMPIVVLDLHVTNTLNLTTYTYDEGKLVKYSDYVKSRVFNEEFRYLTDLTPFGLPGHKGTLDDDVWKIYDKDDKLVSRYIPDIDFEYADSIEVVDGKILVQEIRLAPFYEDEFYDYEEYDRKFTYKNYSIDILTGEKTVFDVPYIIYNTEPIKDETGTFKYLLATYDKIENKVLNKTTNQALFDKEFNIVKNCNDSILGDIIKFGDNYLYEDEGILYDKELKAIKQIPDYLECLFTNEIAGILFCANHLDNSLIVLDKNLEIMNEYYIDDIVHIFRTGVIITKEDYNGTLALGVYDKNFKKLANILNYQESESNDDIFEVVGVTTTHAQYIIDDCGQVFEIEGFTYKMEETIPLFNDGLYFVRTNLIDSTTPLNFLRLGFKNFDYKTIGEEVTTPVVKDGRHPLSAFELTEGENAVNSYKPGKLTYYVYEPAETGFYTIEGSLYGSIESFGPNQINAAELLKDGSNILLRKGVRYLLKIENEVEEKVTITFVEGIKATLETDEEFSEETLTAKPTIYRTYKTTEEGIYEFKLSKSINVNDIKLFTYNEATGKYNELSLEDAGDNIIIFKAPASSEVLIKIVAEATGGLTLGAIIKSEKTFKEQFKYVWENDPKTPWTYNSLTKSYKSTNHDSGSESELKFIAQSDGTLTLNVRVSSEGNYDDFGIYVNGTRRCLISGEDTRVLKFDLKKNDVVKFVYSKDGSQSHGEDIAEITSFTFGAAGEIQIPEGTTNPDLVFPKSE